MEKIDIVIPVYNRSDVLAQNLLRISTAAKADKFYDFRVVIIDDGSTENIIDVIKSEPLYQAGVRVLYAGEEHYTNGELTFVELSPKMPDTLTTDVVIPVHYLKLAHTGNVSKNLNNVLKSFIQADIINILDDDMFIYPGYFKHTLAFHSVQTDAKAACVGRFLSDLWEVQSDLAAACKTITQVEGIRLLMGLSSYKRALFTEHNVQFNENFPLHGDDVALGIELEKAGGRLYFNPDMVGYHADSRVNSLATLKKKLSDSSDVLMRIPVEYKNDLACWTPAINPLNYARQAYLTESTPIEYQEWQERLMDNALTKKYPEYALPLNMASMWISNYISVQGAKAIKATYAKEEKICNYSVLMQQTDYQGCGFWRTELPFLDMLKYTRDVDLTSTMSGNILKYNAILLSRPMVAEWLPIVKQSQRLHNVFLVETDDDIFNIPAENPAERLYKMLGPVIVEFFNSSNGIIVSTEFLKNVMQKKFPSKRIYVHPNSLSEWMGPMIVPEKQDNDDTIRILWAGGSSHGFDLELFHDTFDSLSKNPKIKWLFVGHLPLYARGMPNIEFYPFLPPGLYIKRLRQLRPDIVISPLHDNVFARSKSNIKFLEATLLGAAFIGTQTMPYIADADYSILIPPMNKTSDWKKAVAMASDFEYRKTLVEKAQKWVAQKYMSKDTVKGLAAFVNDVIEQH